MNQDLKKLKNELKELFKKKNEIQYDYVTHLLNNGSETSLHEEFRKIIQDLSKINYCIDKNFDYKYKNAQLEELLLESLNKHKKKISKFYDAVEDYINKAKVLRDKYKKLEKKISEIENN